MLPRVALSMNEEGGGAVICLRSWLVCGGGDAGGADGVVDGVADGVDTNSLEAIGSASTFFSIKISKPQVSPPAAVDGQLRT